MHPSTDAACPCGREGISMPIRVAAGAGWDGSQWSFSYSCRCRCSCSLFISLSICFRPIRSQLISLCCRMKFNLQIWKHQRGLGLWKGARAGGRPYPGRGGDTRGLCIRWVYEISGSAAVYLFKQLPLSTDAHIARTLMGRMIAKNWQLAEGVAKCASYATVGYPVYYLGGVGGAVRQSSTLSIFINVIIQKQYIQAMINILIIIKLF